MNKKEQLIESLRKIFQWRYNCSRVWESRQYWTMKESDFSPLEEDLDIYEEIINLLKDNLPEDNEWDVVEIKDLKQKIYFKCKCDGRVYRWENYCKHCWIKLDWIT